MVAPSFKPIGPSIHNIVNAIRERFPAEWADVTSKNRVPLTICVMKRERVHPMLHAIIDDKQLHQIALLVLPLESPHRTCEPDGVLVLCPSY